MLEPQRGLSLVRLVLLLVILAGVALFAMKVAPSFIEYQSARTAIRGIVAENPKTAAEARNLFERRSEIDNIESVKPGDLDIAKEGNGLVISFSYRKEVPLFKNVGLYIDYKASAGGE